MIKSDWHIHTEASYDATLSLGEIAERAKEYGFKKIGITDHVNFNDESFLKDMDHSIESVKRFQESNPNVVLGVELTPIEKPEFDYCQKNGTREGYVAPCISEPFEIELARTKDELIEKGIRYVIGASHWRVDVPNGRRVAPDMDACIKEWYRQQMWLASDERVTVLGHPWYHGKGLWYKDFTVIPKAMNMDIAAALKENRKYVECNSQFFRSEHATEKFRYQYAEFLRELFEMGIPVTYGSDAHNRYLDVHLEVEKYLAAAGFMDGDIVELAEEALW